MAAGRRECQQKEEPDQLIVMLRTQRLGIVHEIDAVGGMKTDKEIRRGWMPKNLPESSRAPVDLGFGPHGFEYQKGETGVHEQNKYCAQQDKQDVRADL